MVHSNTSKDAAGLNTKPALTPLLLIDWMLRCTCALASG